MNKEQRKRLIELKQDLAGGALSVSDVRCSPENPEPYVLPRDDLLLLSNSIKIPPLRTSTLRRSKRVENTVARYLWGPDALRVWEDREDIRNDELKLVGEVKSYDWPTIKNRGGIWAVLKGALHQAMASVLDTPGLSAYAPFSVLVIPRTKIERALVMFPAQVTLDTPLPVVVSLEKFKALQSFGEVYDAAVAYRY